MQQQSSELVDYAHPCLLAERAIKNLYNAAIEGRLEDAQELALEAATQARIVYIALEHQREASNQSRPMLAQA
jgi:hypothetical protein